MNQKILSLRHYAWADDGGSKRLWNVGKLVPDYTVQQSAGDFKRRQSLEDQHHHPTALRTSNLTNKKFFNVKAGGTYNYH
jgi:hypothetical protein